MEYNDEYKYNSTMADYVDNIMDIDGYNDINAIVDYKIDIDNKKITATINAPLVFIRKLIRKRYKNNMFLISKIMNRLFNDRKFNRYYKIIAIAKCHPDDIWDEEKGKKIAKLKVLIKYKKYLAYVITTVNNFLINNYVLELSNILDKNEDSYNHLIEKLIKETK